jgi:hypothetical protein
MKKVPQSIVAFIFAAMQGKTRQQQNNAANQNHVCWYHLG